MITAKQVASYLIKKANALGDGDSELSGNNDLTNLKLQKILYFVQVEYLQRYQTPLFAEQIQAWRFGPVVKEVYEWLRGCGGYVVTEFDVTLEDTSKFSKKICDFLDQMWAKYNKYSAWGLVEKTHEPDSAWSQVYQNGNGEKEVIDLDLLKTAEVL